MDNNPEIKKVVIPPPDFKALGGLEICKTRHPASLELFYNLINDQAQISFPNHLRPIAYALADENIKYLLITISPGAGKSLLVSVCYPIWELGLDFEKTILGVASAEDQMSKFLQASMGVVEYNKIYRNLYPNSVPDKGAGWSPFRGMFLKRRVKGNPDPSYSISGLFSQSITGKHGQIIIGDDIEDKKYSESEHMLNQLEEAFYKTLLGRRDPRGARIVLVGRRWDINDLYHRLEMTGDWIVMSLPSIREDATKEDPNLYYDVTIPGNLSCVFNNFTPSPQTENIQVYYGYDPNGFYWNEQPAKFDEARMARKSAPAIYQTVYQSKPELSEMAIFKDDDFAFYTPPEDLHLGSESDIVKRLLNRAAMIVQSWDTAFTSEARNDPSVCVTAALISCNQNHRILPGEATITDLHYDVYVLDLFIERLEFADLTPMAEELYEKWNPDKILVEKGALGIPLVQHLTKIAAPVEGIAVQNVSKRTRALNGAKAGSAQGWMRSWRVKFPKDATWFPDTKREFIKFTGAKGQRDDRVDALVQIINFTIDYGISAQEMPEGWRTDEEIDAQIRSWTTPKSSIDGYIDTIKTYYNPMIGLCQTCKHFSQNYCKYHKISVSALHSCLNYDCREEVSEWQTINLK